MPRSRPLRLWVGTLSMRRWHAQSKLFALVLAVAMTSGTVLAGSLLLVHSTEEAGVRGALASMTAERVDVVVRIVNPNSPVAETRSAIDGATEDAYGAGASWTSTGWITSDWVTTASGVHSYLVEMDDPSAAATLTEGRWPTSPRGVAVPEQAARSLGAVVGNTVKFDDSGTAVELRVEGLYRAAPDSGVFWENDPLNAAGDIVDFPEPDRQFYNPIHAVGPLIVSHGGVDAAGISPAQLEVVQHPSFSKADVAGLASLRERVADAETAIALAVPHSSGPLIVNTTIGEALGDVAAGLAATRDLTLIIALVLFVVVAVATSAVTRLLVESRAAEFDLLGARGASRRQVALAAGLDALVIGGLVALASPWGGVLLRAIIVGLPPLTAARLDQWIRPDDSAWISSGAVAVIVACLVCLPSAGRQVRLGNLPPGALSLAAKTAVLVAAGLMVWRATTTDPPSGDLLLAATPAVLLVAIALVGSRLASAVTRPIAALTGRARGVVAPLAGWFAARGPGRSAGVALVALAVGASVVVLGMGATWQQAIRDDAAIAVGPPARIVLDPDARSAAGAPITDGAAPVLRRQTVVGKHTDNALEGEEVGQSVQVLGLNAEGRRALSTGPAAVAGGSRIADEFPSADPVDTGPVLPRGTESLQAMFTMSGPEGARAVVSFVCEDDAGSLAVYPLAPIALGTATVSTGAITPPDEHGSIRLVAMTVRVQQADDTVATGDATPFALTASGLAASVGSETAPTPLVLVDAGGWVGSVSGNQSGPPNVGVADSQIRITTKDPLGAGSTTYGAVGWNPTIPIAAVLPESLADDLDVTTDSTLTGFIGGIPVAFLMVGDTRAVPGAATFDDLRALEAGLPSASKAALTIAVDGRALVHYLVQGSTSGPLVDEFWLGADPAEVSAAATNGDDGTYTIAEPAALAQRMVEAPLRAAIPASAAIAVVASLLLALAGFGARAAAVSRSRRLEAAQLRAVGLSRRGMLGVSSIDTVAIAVAGIAIGLLSGLVTLGLVGTRITSGSQAEARALVLPWQATALLPLALLGAIGIVSLGVALGQRRLPLSELLRTGADG